MPRTRTRSLALFNGTAGEVDLINNDIKVPYSDQFSLGIRNRLGDWNTSVAVTRVDSKDGFVFTLGNRYPNGDFWQNRSQPWGNSPPGLAGALLVGNSGIETNSTQVLLSAEKPFTEESNWGASICVHLTDADAEPRHQRALRLRRVSIQEYPFIAVERGGQASLWWPRARTARPWGLTFARQVHLVDADSHTTSYLPGDPDGIRRMARRARRSDTRAGNGDGYMSLDLQVTKDFNMGDVTSFYLRFDILNATNEQNLVDYTEDSTGLTG